MAIFDCARWMPIHANISGAMHANWGLLLHHAVANGSLYNYFNSPSAQASAHFWVSRDGWIEQYVDSEQVAWHAGPANDTYCGVETEGCSVAPHAEPMTTQMVNALATLYAEGHRRHGWPNALANQDGQRGFGYHRMVMNTACPCDERLQRRREILDKAFGLVPAVLAAPSGSEASSVCVVTAPGRVDMFVVGTDHGVYQCMARDWVELAHNGWIRVGDENTWVKSIAAAWSPDYKLLYLTAQGVNDLPHINVWDGANWTGWVANPNGVCAPDPYEVGAR